MYTGNEARKTLTQKQGREYENQLIKLSYYLHKYTMVLTYLYSPYTYVYTLNFKKTKLADYPSLSHEDHSQRLSTFFPSYMYTELSLTLLN